MPRLFSDFMFQSIDFSVNRVYEIAISVTNLFTRVTLFTGLDVGIEMIPLDPGRTMSLVHYI